MRIGVDIDGVVSDSYPYWLQELNQYFGKDIKTITDYDMHKVFEVPSTDMNDFFVGNAERLLFMPEIVAGAKEGIETLIKEGHEIVYVTARTPEEKDVTLRWFLKREIPHEHVLFSGFNSKVSLVKEWDIEAFVEDYHVNAKQIAEIGVPVFLLTASYNQDHEELPGAIMRCQSWQDIVEGIRKLKDIKKDECS
ncbi:5' nucleotidase, NT5C type [Desulfosporosinus sp. SB140]|uniref:5' nucleotidase, NT5C type n=1 Tax=Desulfosporosinus paludis TaxID=3115649 RepID=UPI00388DFF71